MQPNIPIFSKKDSSSSSTKRRFLSCFGWAWIISVVLYIIMRQYPDYFFFLPVAYFEAVKKAVLWFAIVLFALYVYDERWFRPK